MNADIAGVADLFVKNNSWRNSKKRYCFKSSSKDSIKSDFQFCASNEWKEDPIGIDN